MHAMKEPSWTTKNTRFGGNNIGSHARGTRNPNVTIAKRHPTRRRSQRGESHEKQLIVGQFGTPVKERHSLSTNSSK
eukprot:scaffold5471_cov212-Alexandrium_tamarense.AAC.9